MFADVMIVESAVSSEGEPRRRSEAELRATPSRASQAPVAIEVDARRSCCAWDDEQEAERLAARRARKEKELAMLADSVGSGDLGLNLGSKMLKRVAGAASVQPQALE